MNRTIILFGFSGSGKSTIANLIGARYGLRVIHPSGILRDLYEQKKVDLSNTRYNTGFWESEKGVRLFKSRLNKNKPIDIKVNKILIEEANRGNVVIDSWSLPWLTKVGIRFYLAAGLQVRARRVAKRGGISYARAIYVVALKDEETRKLFRRIYKFDIRTDHDVFDYVIHTDSMTRQEVFARVCTYLDRAEAGRGNAPFDSVR